MPYFLLIMTCVAYIFIIAMYSTKAVKYLRLPRHMRWELYPVMHEERYRYGGSYFEEMDWLGRRRVKARLRSILFLMKEYFTLGEYFRRHVSYWLALYPWHVGFVLIIGFHICTFLAAVLMVLGLPVSAESSFLTGKIVYYVVLYMGVTSFIAGTVGSIGMVIKRSVDEDLRAYATPQNFITYIFCLVVFLTGIYAWYFVDPGFYEHREFWVGLITWSPKPVSWGAAPHIIVFNLFLIYLPFTRSMHYVTRLFAFLLIRWDDEPNIRGSALEHQLIRQFGYKASWAGPHIKSGETWGDIVKE
jgi:nitrate reductase gamma subunit